MKLQFVSQLLTSASVALLLLSCQKDFSAKNDVASIAAGNVAKGNQAEKVNTYYGPQMQLGDGMVRTFFTVTHTSVPLEIGIEMTAGALQGLPDEDVALSFPFHQKAMASTPFEHVLLDWNWEGHEPVIYELPHFDFHFYMTTEAERMAVSASSPLMEQLPPHQYWPQGYVPTPGGVPQMGKHWINPASPEISGGQTFTHTMIWGSYAGAFTFIEPMITRAFLLSGEQVHLAFGQPSQFMTAPAYYPTTYNIYSENGKYYVSLTNFVWRQ